MKKCIALLVLLLCVSLLCSCDNASDKDHTASETQKTLMGTNSDDNPSSKTESALVENDSNASAVGTNAPVDSTAAKLPSSENIEENPSSVSSGEGQTFNSSDEYANTPFLTDEYELPFIPK